MSLVIIMASGKAKFSVFVGRNRTRAQAIEKGWPIAQHFCAFFGAKYKRARYYKRTGKVTFE